MWTVYDLKSSKAQYFILFLFYFYFIEKLWCILNICLHQWKIVYTLNFIRQHYFTANFIKFTEIIYINKPKCAKFQKRRFWHNMVKDFEFEPNGFSH